MVKKTNNIQTTTPARKSNQQKVKTAKSSKPTSTAKSSKTTNATTSPAQKSAKYPSLLMALTMVLMLIVLGLGWLSIHLYRQSAVALPTTETPKAQETATLDKLAKLNNLDTKMTQPSNERINSLVDTLNEQAIALDKISQAQVKQSVNIQTINKSIQAFSTFDTIKIKTNALIKDALWFLDIHHNSDAAILLLQKAAIALYKDGNPDFLTQQNMIQKAVGDLIVLPKPEVQIVIKQLRKLSHQVKDLTFSKAQINANNANQISQHASANSLGKQVWQDIKGLIKITRDDANRSGKVISQEAKEAMRLLAHLHLKSIQLIAILNQQKNFEQEIHTTIAWLKQTFNQDHKTTRDFIDALDSISQKLIAVNAWPESINALRTISNATP